MAKTVSAIQDAINNITEALTAIMDASYEQGEASAANKSGATEKLAQIDRMARQIEECHSTIRRRNLEIRELEIKLANKCKDCC